MQSNVYTLQIYETTKLRHLKILAYGVSKSDSRRLTIEISAKRSGDTW